MKTSTLFHQFARSSVLLFTLCAGFAPGRAADLDLAKATAEADKGDREAQYSVGRVYFKGEGVPQDLLKAMDYFRRAAEQGNFKAQNNLGSMYAQGQGVPKDVAEAIKWFRKAADQGDAVGSDCCERGCRIRGAECIDFRTADFIAVQ